MVVSLGFFEKIRKWILSVEDPYNLSDVLYLPFETNGNPYKSKLMIVGPNPTAVFFPAIEELSLFAEGLVNANVLKDRFGDQLKLASKDYKGARKLMHWLEEHCHENAVVSYVNTYATNAAAELKTLLQEDPSAYQRGVDIFVEVLREFNTDIMLLHGSQAFDQFTSAFDVKFDETLSLKQIEEGGHYATFHFEGRHIKVYACRSLATFTANSAQFTALREHLKAALSV